MDWRGAGAPRVCFAAPPVVVTVYPTRFTPFLPCRPKVYFQSDFRFPFGGGESSVVNAWCGGNLEVDVDVPERNASAVKIPVLRKSAVLGLP